MPWLAAVDVEVADLSCHESYKNRLSRCVRNSNVKAFPTVISMSLGNIYIPNPRLNSQFMLCIR